jgi:hypothetical protein
MFPRFLVLLASLSLLVSSASAANLRKDSSTVAVLAESATEIPIDHERAAAVYNSYMKQVEKRNKNAEKFAKESIAAAHVNARQHVENLHKAGKLAEAKSKATTLNADMNVRNGAFVTRRRPNADCSGIVSNIDALKIDGSCHSDGFGGSYYMSCAHENNQGNVQMISTYFTEEGCLNGLWSYEVVRSEPKCQYNHYAMDNGMGMDSPSMMGAQCTSNNMAIAIQSGGVTHAFFAQGDDTCNGSPQSLHVQRYGACELVYSTDNSDNVEGYFYMTLDSCAPETGKMQLTLYTDSACRRPVMRGSFNMGGMNGAPYGACTHQGDGDFGQTMCFPEGGMP